MGAHILIIEDNDANLDLMGYLLNSAGHTTIAARDGALGVIRDRSGGIDLVICDIQLPRVDGYEIARRLRADPLTKHLPLVAVTASATGGESGAFLAAGFDACIPKPIAPDRFVSEIEQHLPPALRTHVPE